MKTVLTMLALCSATSAFAATTQLDDLIRGEMSAIKVYDQVLEKVTEPKEVDRLKSIRMDHKNAVATLKRYASEDVLEDAQTTGAWGTFTKAWTGTAKLMGNDAAVKALSQGEEHGVSEYKEALADKNTPADLKNLIKTNLLPKQQDHIQTLNTLL